MASGNSNTMSLYGLNLSESGSIGSFSVPFIVLNMIGGGLSWFVAMAWSNLFQSALNEYKSREEGRGKKTNPVWLSFVLALVATVFTVAIMYLMVRSYSGYLSRLKITGPQ